jgi:N-acetylglucosaminyldiphosphoundecaprenol N-acetyl-beta-D-mannosaminyltransferase
VPDNGAFLPAVDVLGVNISSLTLPLAVDQIERWIESGAREYVCVTGVHGVMESRRDASIREIHNRAGMVTPDGMPMVWASHWAGATWVRRVYGPDLMLDVCARAAERGWSSFFYGGAPGVAERLAERLTARFPALRIAGAYSPPFRALTPAESGAIVDRINQAEPTLVWVGLSTPKQERWMAEHRAHLEAPVLLGVGAAFDFHAGLKPQAPAVVQRSGLEWLYRTVTEPRRLARRYARNNSAFVLALIGHVVRGQAPVKLLPQ